MPTQYRVERVNAAETATIIARITRGVDPNHSVSVDLYGYDHGCPNISFRMKSSGYKGSVVLGGGSNQIVVPANQRIVLKGWWLQTYSALIKKSCATVLTFRPRGGATYEYEYDERSEETCTSDAALVTAPAIAGAEPGAAPIDSLVSVNPKMGFWDYTADELCNIPP